MPAITPLPLTTTAPEGITRRTQVSAGARTMPNDTPVTLVQVNINPQETCDLLVVAHISASQSGTLAKEAHIDVQVRLDGSVIGSGGVVCGTSLREYFDERLGLWIEAPFGSRHSGGILASALDVPAGPHTITVVGTGWSSNGRATIHLGALSVSIIEFYR